MKELALLSRARSHTLTAEDCELIRDMTEMIKLVQSVDDVERLDEKDLATVRTLIQRHFDYTHSQVAWRLLSGWKETVKHFVRVMPVEYRSVLAKAHLDTDAARLASI